MPFTLSHIAASLPLLNRSNAAGWKVALVAGTMAPDCMFPIPYFGERQHTHSVLGLLLLDLPFAFLVAWIWCRFLIQRLSWMPGMESLRSERPRAISIPMTLFGALLGSATHLIWDMFTHRGSPLLAHPFFDSPLFVGQAGYVPVSQALWFANSFLGLAAVVWYVRIRMHSKESRLRSSFLTGPWLRVAGAFLAPYLLILFLLAKGRPDHLGQILINLVYLVDLVRMGMVVSFLVAMIVLWWETGKLAGAASRSEPDSIGRAA